MYNVTSKASAERGFLSTMNSPDLSIIIVNWKSQAFVNACLTSIFTTSSTLSYEVIVVDNASYDGCAEMVASAFPQVLFVKSERNLGFAGANNLAFAQSHGRNILFLNPDTEVLGQAIQQLVSSLESLPDAGMVGAHLLNSDLTLQTTCITSIPSISNQVLSSDILRKTFPKWPLWGMKPLFEDIHNPAKVEAISGACMLAKREVVERINAFSTNYFMYLEDMDLCLKVVRSGWNIYYVPDAMIVHHAGGSSSSRQENNFSSIMTRESLITFFKLYRGTLYALLYRLSMALLAIWRMLILAAAIPMSIHPKGYRFVRRAVSKWFSILIWSMGLTRWARLQPHKVDIEADGRAVRCQVVNPLVSEDVSSS